MRSQHPGSKLGTRFTCFSCGTKFYDLNRPNPSCPQCEADQREAPKRDIRSLLSSGTKKRKKPEKKAEPELPVTDEDVDDDEDDDLELLGENEDLLDDEDDEDDED